jgi:hypothetical protein
LFVSHSHKDEDLVDKLVDVITSMLEVPEGAIRCTSRAGYKLDVGTMASDALRRELGSAACVVTILTPNSVAADWVLFELGASWANEKVAIPLLANGLKDKDIPGPLRGAAGGELTDPSTINRLIDQLHKLLGWAAKPDLSAWQKGYDLCKCAEDKSFLEDDAAAELSANFTAKLRRIGDRQREILHHIVDQIGNRNFIPQEELGQTFTHVPTHIYFRLEQLRYLGFLTRTEISKINREPTYGWAPCAKYLQEAEVRR